MNSNKTVNLREAIVEALSSTKQFNKSRADKARDTLKKQLKANLGKGQSIEENQGIIDRFYGVKAHNLNAIQQAFEDSLKFGKGVVK